MMNKLIILSGPSCVGKSPLYKALDKFYPDITRTIKTVVLYNSRRPRPKEKEGLDYYFRLRKDIEKLRSKKKFVVLDVRGDLQALDIEEVKKELKTSNMLFEGNPFAGKILISHPSLKNINKVSIFISPVSKEEALFLKKIKNKISIKELIGDIMSRKLLRRTRKQKGILSLGDLENIQRRAQSAYQELKEAYRYDYVIPNHDGEDSENWDAFYYPLGEARRTLLALVSILKGEEKPLFAEKWSAALF